VEVSVAKDVFAIDLVGARRDVPGEAAGPSTGVTNYLVGNSPAGWVTGVERFSRVRYRRVLPGIDVVYYDSGGNLEYDFILAPGADPSRIRMRFGGQEALSLDRRGNLVLSAGSSRMIQNRPIAFQTVGGQRRRVDAGYVKDGPAGVALRLGRYDRNRPLIVDPLLQYATYFGAADHEFGRAVAADSSGSAYVAGGFALDRDPLDYPSRPRTVVGSPQLFAAKFAPDGKSLEYLTYFGGSTRLLPSTSTDNLQALAVAGACSSQCSLYVVGTTNSADFPTTAGAYSKACQCSGTDIDVFLTVLGPNGALEYSTFLGGGTSEQVYAVSVDNSGDAFLAGSTVSENFPVTAGAVQPFCVPRASGGPSSAPECWSAAFLTRIRPGAVGPAGLVYSTFLGGARNTENGQPDVGLTVTVAGEEVYVAGLSSAKTLPLDPKDDATSGPGRRGFVTKLRAIPAGPLSFVKTFPWTFDDDESVKAARYCFTPRCKTYSPRIPLVLSSGAAYLGTQDGIYPLDELDGTNSLGDRLPLTYDGQPFVIDSLDEILVVGNPIRRFGIDGGLRGTVAFPMRGEFQDMTTDGAGGLYIAGKVRADPDDPASHPEPVPDSQAGFQKDYGGGWDAYLLKYWSPADLAVAQAAVPSEKAREASQVTFTVSVENRGPEDASNASVTDRLPTGVVLQQVISSQGDCTTPAAEVICTLGRLNAGASATIQVKVIPELPGAITNLARVDSDMPDPALDNNSTTLTLPVECAACAPPPPLPLIERLDPNSGPVAGGTAVAISGKNLAQASVVKVGGVEVAELCAPQASQAPCLLPVTDQLVRIVTPAAAAAGPVHVRVTTPAGTSPEGPSDVFTYVAPPAPIRPPDGEPLRSAGPASASRGLSLGLPAGPGVGGPASAPVTGPVLQASAGPGIGGSAAGQAAHGEALQLGVKQSGAGLAGAAAGQEAEPDPAPGFRIYQMSSLDRGDGPAILAASALAAGMACFVLGISRRRKAPASAFGIAR
ncbi:MAG: IPT/TIG domain-containing protein, partial [Actinomycetota bacterium]